MNFIPYGYGNIQKTYKSIDEALSLVKNAVQKEKEDEVFYNYLIEIAPSEDEKSIITTIRNDEEKHTELFKETYMFFTGHNITPPENSDFVKPKSYIEGIKKAKFNELSAVESYRDIRAGLPSEYFRDIVFEILTDELKHADKYNYILYLNSENRFLRHENTDNKLEAKSGFTLEEASEIAKSLGIDFNKEKFDLEQFRMGLNTELEHGRKNLATNVTGDDPILTGKIALAHLTEFPDYYTRLSKLEEEAKAYWLTK